MEKNFKALLPLFDLTFATVWERVCGEVEEVMVSKWDVIKSTSCSVG